VAELRESPAERRIRVLLVDDDAPFLEGLRTVVEADAAFTVVGLAGNGLEALELVETLEPEAVVIDLHMPLLDGVSAVARMRRDHPALCLIAMTGDDAEELHRAVAEAGADAVYMKAELIPGLSGEIAAARAGRLAAV
jgi:DNA-binding NarL/FixJ family response regulator